MKHFLSRRNVSFLKLKFEFQGLLKNIFMLFWHLSDSSSSPVTFRDAFQAGQIQQKVVNVAQIYYSRWNMKSWSKYLI